MKCPNSKPAETIPGFFNALKICQPWEDSETYWCLVHAWNTPWTEDRPSIQAASADVRPRIPRRLSVKHLVEHFECYLVYFSYT